MNSHGKLKWKLMEPLSLSLLLPLLLLLSLPLLFLKHLLLPSILGKQPKTSPLLPPAASSLPILAHIFFLGRSFFHAASIIRSFHTLHGPIFTLRLFPFSRPFVFISDASLAHSALVHHGATFADRPRSDEPARQLNVGDSSISSAPYGSLWRLLRRNLSAQTLHPSRIRLFAPARDWALRGLLDALRSQSGRVITVRESFQQAIFSLLVLMCFGEKLCEREIREIESPQVFLLKAFTSFNVFAVVPAVTKILFRKRWEKIFDARRRQMEIFLPMIKARRDRKINSSGGGLQNGFEYCYVDSLLDMQLPEEGGRALTDEEIVCLCHEFLSGGIDTTTTALEWTMAELVQNQDLQSKLALEIKSSTVSDQDEGTIKEEDLQRMPYLKAVVMESLRRHPPGHFVLPHSVTEDVTFEGFQIPKGARVNFSVADVNMDGRNWTEPMTFRPERFMAGGDGEAVDITGSREIKMMPFGVGRRICPGYGLAMLHLELFVANLVREFVWKNEAGEEVDLSEKLEFTTVMKNPLRAQIIPRSEEN